MSSVKIGLLTAVLFCDGVNEIIIIIIITAVEFSLGGSSTNNIHKRCNTKTLYKQYKTQ
jgi:hypothetical protein